MGNYIRLAAQGALPASTFCIVRAPLITVVALELPVCAGRLQSLANSLRAATKPCADLKIDAISSVLSLSEMVIELLLVARNHAWVANRRKVTNRLGVKAARGMCHILKSKPTVMRRTCKPKKVSKKCSHESASLRTTTPKTPKFTSSFSNSNRPRSRTSGEYLVDFFMSPFSIETESPGQPGRVKLSFGVPKRSNAQRLKQIVFLIPYSRHFVS